VQTEEKMTDRDIAVIFRRLAIKAGAAIMEVYGREDFGVRTKDDASPVTEADEAADRIIRVGLAEAFPGVVVVTEELSQSHGLKAATFIIVDPLDGTKEFIKRAGDFTVNIARVTDGTPDLGVVYAPAKGRLFLGIGDEAFEEKGDLDPASVGEWVPISVENPKGADLLVVASKSHRDQATDDYIARYPVRDFTSAGSSLKFCLVATGEAHLYPRLGPTMEWDTAAGDAVLRAAGGRVVDFETHAPFAYGKPGYRNGFFIAAAPGVDLVWGWFW